jgi:hypothetical protein
MRFHRLNSIDDDDDDDFHELKDFLIVQFRQPFGVSLHTEYFKQVFLILKFKFFLLSQTTTSQHHDLVERRNLTQIRTCFSRVI